jgi:hypothetical protein
MYFTRRLLNAVVKHTKSPTGGDLALVFCCAQLNVTWCVYQGTLGVLAYSLSISCRNTAQGIATYFRVCRMSWRRLQTSRSCYRRCSRHCTCWSPGMCCATAVACNAVMHASLRSERCAHCASTLCAVLTPADSVLRPLLGPGPVPSAEHLLGELSVYECGKYY